MRQLTVAIALLFFVCANAQQTYHEQYRPQVHFSPKAHWTNDPNGMVYFDGVYHLFFQYYPDGTTWGPMHWGHATSKDLVHWQEQPVALYPDEHGYIFSGSAVVDSNNTSGFGKNGKVPLIAIFTHHDTTAAVMATNKFQNQSIAYSLDNGVTWTKYSGNPVLKNPGIADFRDPKVMWYAPTKKWIMTLATKDRITFYSSPDFKNWIRESEFGAGLGAHGGVWECPDLFPLQYENKTVWVLVGNINPGAPNGGSATQYFLGDFDGHTFTAMDTTTRWMDYGPDEYAGITWSNTGKRKIFLGWMSNWQYANEVPSVAWRNAMTIPRDLHLAKANGKMYVASLPVPELKNIAGKKWSWKNISVNNAPLREIKLPCIIRFDMDALKDFTITFSNDKGEKELIGYNASQQNFYMDRSASGETKFNNGFAAMHTAPRFAQTKRTNVYLVIDESSAELFADDGLTVMTQIFFPSVPYNHIGFEGAENSQLTSLEYVPLKSIWP